MAEEDREEEEAKEDPLALIEARAKNQLNYIFIAGITSLLFIACLGFTYVSLSARVISSTQAPLAEMTYLAGNVSEEFSNLNLAVEFHNHQMEAISRRLDAINPSVDEHQFALLQQVMLGQEKDFQYFLDTVKLAVHGLSEMVSGSRGWRDEFNSKLDAAISNSKGREFRLNNDSPVAAEADSNQNMNPENSVLTP
ncbi:MAG: hypothetical protein IIC60_09730 [Proteobacteria bacterium]|nr:hypothetical protein [Pseudomonadota bacterium]